MITDIDQELNEKLLNGAVVIVAMEYTNRHMFNNCIDWWKQGFSELSIVDIPHQWVDLYETLGKTGYIEYMQLLIQDYHHILRGQFE